MSQNQRWRNFTNLLQNVRNTAKDRDNSVIECDRCSCLCDISFECTQQDTDILLMTMQYEYT